MNIIFDSFTSPSYINYVKQAYTNFAKQAYGTKSSDVIELDESEVIISDAEETCDSQEGECGRALAPWVPECPCSMSASNGPICQSEDSDSLCSSELLPFIHSINHDIMEE